MKRIYYFLSIIAVFFFICPFAAFSQQQDLQKDAAVKSFEISSRTSRPFSILFKEGAGYTLADARQLFSKYLGATAAQLTLKTHQVTNGITVDRYQQYFKGIKVEHGNYIIAAKNNTISYITGDFFSIDPATGIIPAITEEAARNKAWLYLDGVIPADDQPAGELVFIEDGLDNKELNGKLYLAYKFLMNPHSKPLSTQDIYVDATTGKVLFTNLQIMNSCYNHETKSNPANKEYAITIASPIQHTTVNAVKPAMEIAAGAATRYSANVTNMVTRLNAGNVYQLEAQLATELYPTHVRSVNHAPVSTFSTITQYNNAIAASTEITDADNNWTAAEFPNATKDNAALDVQWGAQRVYDYWKARHNRNSWNNANGVLNLFVHGDVNWQNAFWQGGSGINSMFFGDGVDAIGGYGPMTSIDVVGHEIGHGVCQNTSNLTYSNQSGALNEAFSDIWGASIERFSDPHEIDAVPKSYFELGEEYTNGGGALRSMSNPKLYKQPDTYLGVNWWTSTGDNGGVHYNSGVLNHWFYLVVAGGTGTNDLGNSFEVLPIGWEDAEHIAFLCETSLAANATYANCRTAMINASITLFGACSPQTVAVTNAFYAVGIGAQFVPCGAEVLFSSGGFTLSETVTPATCPPGTKTVEVPISLPNAASQQTDATLTLLGGTASNNIDYTANLTTVSWAAGETGSRTFSITINDDHAIEDSETILFGYTLNNHGGNAVAAGFSQTCKVIITNDDLAPADYGGPMTRITTGTIYYDIVTGPFQGSKSKKRIQSLYRASELLAAGYKAGNINRIYYDIFQVPANVSFDNYSLKIGNTTASGLTAIAIPTGTVTVYSGTLNITTSDVGLFKIDFSAPFYWDGLSNIIIESCYDNPAAASDVAVLVSSPAANSSVYVSATSGGGICNTASTTTTQYRPNITLQMGVPVQTVASPTVSRTAYLGPNADVPFYSDSDGKIMARIKNTSSFDYGCTQVVIDRDGTGTTQFWNTDPLNALTNKTLKVIPANDNPSGSYEITLFYTQAEHDGWEAATSKDWETSAFIVKVKGHSISEVTPATPSFFPAVDASSSTARSLYGAEYKVTASFNSGFSGFAVGNLAYYPASAVPLQRIYVDASKTSGQRIGNSWGNALTSFKQATDYADKSILTEIWVAKGTYKPTTPGGDRTIYFNPTSNVKMYGGFAGTEANLAERNFQLLHTTNRTVLSGDLNGDDGPDFMNTADNTATIIKYLNVPGTENLLDGFTVKSAYNEVNDGQPGGVFIFNSNVQIQNCTLDSNFSNGRGGAILNLYSSPTIGNCSFTGNRAFTGAAVYNFSALGNTVNPVFTNCTFTGNQQTGAGSIFYNSTTNNGSNISLSLTNCSFSGNNEMSIYGWAQTGNNSITTNMKNCVFFGNGGANTFSTEPAGFGTVVNNANYSLFDNGVTGFTGNNNIIATVSPFASATDLHIPCGNQGGNSGTNAGVPPTDLDGNPRPFPGTVTDMGAYEAQNCIILPVGLVKFTAIAQGAHNLLNWQTSTEMNNRYFEVQHSSDGINFTAIGTVAGYGTTSLPRYYSFTDIHPYTGITYYRLRQVDIDGRENYSIIVHVSRQLSNSISIYPNPARDIITVSVSNDLLNTKLVLVDVTGKQLGEFMIRQSVQTIDLGKYASGVYLLKMANGETERIIKK